MWLVNTGWSGGKYGLGERMSLKITRQILDNIHNGTLEKEEYETIPGFNLSVPKKCDGIPDQAILNPVNTWKHKSIFHETQYKLAKQFIDNFEKYEDGTPESVIQNGGPDIKAFR